MLSRHHPFFPKFTELVREAAAQTCVMDLGTSQRFAKEVGLVRELFRDNSYLAGGFMPERVGIKEPCDFHCDVQQMPEIPDGTVGAILNIDVLEHVEEPGRAVREFHRILCSGGLCLVTVPFLSSYHGKRALAGNPVYDATRDSGNEDHSHAGYGDFWRFTHEGLARLFAEAGFCRVDIWPIDGPLICRLELLHLYNPLARFGAVRRLLAKLDHPRLGRATTRHVVRAEKA